MSPRVVRSAALLGGLVTAMLALAVPAHEPTGQAKAQTSSTCTPRWRVVARSPNAGDLTKVDALSAKDVWALAGFSEVVHWNGRRFRRFAPLGKVGALPGGGFVKGLAALSPRNVWVVGADAPSETGRVPAALHWNGRRWRRERLPLPPGTKGWLQDVVTFGANDVWVVGWLEEPDLRIRKAQPLVMRRTGGRWRVIDVGRFGTLSFLYAVDGTRSNNVWAVGSTSDFDADDLSDDELVFRWNGRVWTRLRSALAAGDEDNVPIAVDVTRGGAWTLHGEHEFSGQYVVRWRGRTGRVAHARELWALNDVAAVSERNVWVVGNREDPSRPLILHWNGRSWRVRSTLFDRPRRERVVGRTPVSLESLSVLSETDIWAGGSVWGGYALLARYSC